MNIAKKICLLGDETVGKSSMAKRFADNAFDDKYKATIGVKIFNKNLEIHDGKSINFVVWDIQGGRDLISSPQQYYRGASALIFVCDITNEESLKAIDYYLGIVSEKYPLAKKMLLINKIDLVKDSSTVLSFKEKHAPSFNFIFSTSAKTGKNVIEAFTNLGTIL